MNNNDNTKIFLDKSILHFREHEDYFDHVSSQGVCFYALLRCFYFSKNTKQELIDLNEIFFRLTGKQPSRKILQNLRAGVFDLERVTKIITVTKIAPNKFLICFNDEYFFDSTNNKNDNDEDTFKPFVIIFRHELEKVLNIPNVNSFKLLHYFLIKMGTLNNSSKKEVLDTFRPWGGVGCNSINNCSSECCISKKTALRYDKILEENDLLTILRSKKLLGHQDGNNFFIERQFTNCYARPENIDNLIKFFKGRERLSGQNIIELSDDANFWRQRSQIFNNFIKTNKIKYQSAKTLLEDTICQFEVVCFKKHKQPNNKEIRQKYESLKEPLKKILDYCIKYYVIDESEKSKIFKRIENAVTGNIDLILIESEQEN